MRIGGTAVLHTWDQKLRFHPHLHVVVPNAGFEVESGGWKTGSGVWLAPVKVLASLFRRRFLKELARAHGSGELEFHGSVAHLANPGEFHAALAAARGRDWVVYAKRPFRGPEQVFRYLARYTHRIAISDRRIVAFDGENVTFRHRKPVGPGQIEALSGPLRGRTCLPGFSDAAEPLRPHDTGRSVLPSTADRVIEPRHSESCAFRRSLALPARAATDTSPDASRRPAHGSRWRRFVTPFLLPDFHRLSSTEFA